MYFKNASYEINKKISPLNNLSEIKTYISFLPLCKDFLKCLHVELHL